MSLADELASKARAHLIRSRNRKNGVTALVRFEHFVLRASERAEVGESFHAAIGAAKLAKSGAKWHNLAAAALDLSHRQDFGS